MFAMIASLRLTIRRLDRVKLSLSKCRLGSDWHSTQTHEALPPQSVSMLALATSLMALGVNFNVFPSTVREIVASEALLISAWKFALNAHIVPSLTRSTHKPTPMACQVLNLELLVMLQFRAKCKTSQVLVEGLMNPSTKNALRREAISNHASTARLGRLKQQSTCLDASSSTAVASLPRAQERLYPKENKPKSLRRF